MAEFRMPSLGADMTEGTLLEWLVQPGAVVHRGDIVAVVDTAKSAIDVEVFEDGRVEELLITPGTTVAVGTPLARLGPAGEEVEQPEAAALVAEERGEDQTPERPEAAEHTQAAEQPETPEPGAVVVSPLVRHLAHELGVDLSRVVGTGRAGAVTRADVEGAAAGSVAREPEPSPAPQPVPSGRGEAGEGRLAASPFARRRAAELGIDLVTVSGSGPAGVISVADVEKAAAAGPPAPLAAPPARKPPHPRRQRQHPEQAAPVAQTSASEKAAAMRQAIGALMARSKREIPHYYLQTTIDLHRALTWLEGVNAERPVAGRILPAALLLKASATAARRVPEVNGFFVDGAFQAQEHVHLGVAVSLRGGGLIAPALHDADLLSVDEVMERLKDLVTRARSGRLRGSEMSDPTVTVTNLGDQGVEAVHGVIYPPQVALVGFGRVVQRPWAVDGMLAVRRVVTATLAADHRVTDGHRGGLYLAAVDAALQNPEEL